MAEFSQYEPNRMCWIDLSSNDVQGSTKFYCDLFGFEADVAPPEYGGYAILMQKGKAAMGIGPCYQEGQPTAWTMYTAVGDIDAARQNIENNGGKLLGPAMEVPARGTMTIYQDPAGAIGGIWQAGGFAGSEIGNEPGTWVCSEYNTTDLNSVKSFYENTFNWNIADWEGLNGYQTVMLDDFVAGIMHDVSNDAGAPFTPQWVNHMCVASLEESLQQAQQLGAKQIGEVRDVQIGRCVVMQDPQGATFGMFEGAGQ